MLSFVFRTISMQAASERAEVPSRWRSWVRLLNDWRIERTYRRLVASVPGSTLAEFVEPAERAVRPAPPRAVPLAVQPLTAALDKHPSARDLFRHLVIVEATLRLAKGDPFSFISPGVLAQAIKQLEVVGDFAKHPGLRLLHLQMRRRQCENEARAQAEANGRVAKWDPRKPRGQEADPAPVNGWVAGGTAVSFRIRHEIILTCPGSQRDELGTSVPFQATQPYYPYQQTEPMGLSEMVGAEGRDRL